jgi:hypothetical protein
MREHFDLFVEEEEPEKAEYVDDTDSPSKSPAKEEMLKADEINGLGPTPVETTGEVNEFDMGESPDFRKTRDLGLVEPPSAAIPESKPLETPKKKKGDDL